MTMTEKIDGLIKSLEAAKADAAKFDNGKKGAPGTRIRKVALQVSRDLGQVRKDVLEARNAS